MHMGSETLTDAAAATQGMCAWPSLRLVAMLCPASHLPPADSAVGATWDPVQAVSMQTVLLQPPWACIPCPACA